MIFERLETAVVLIKGGNRTSFGTAFAVHQDLAGTYLVTCAHVLDDLETVEDLKIRDCPVTVVALGRKEDFDLAVLRVSGQLEYPILTTCVGAFVPGSPFLAGGFYALGDQKVAETFEGTLEKTIRVESSTQGSVSGWYLSLSPGNTLQRGCSGAPVVQSETGFVIGIITHRLGESRGVALSIEALGKIWTDAPPGLLDSAEGHQKQRLLLELLRGLPETPLNVSALQDLAWIRSSLTNRNLSGKAALDLAATSIAKASARLTGLLKSTEEHLFTLNTEFEETKAPLVTLEIWWVQILDKLAAESLRAKTKIGKELTLFFDALAEGVRQRCREFFESHQPSWFNDNYLRDFNEAVQSELISRFNAWEQEHLSRLIAGFENGLTTIIADAVETASPKLDLHVDPTVKLNLSAFQVSLLPAIDTPVAGMVALHLLPRGFFLVSGLKGLFDTRATELIVEQVKAAKPRMTSYIDASFSRTVESIRQEISHEYEYSRVTVLSKLAQLKQQLESEERRRAEYGSWFDRISGIWQEIEQARG